MINMDYEDIIIDNQTLIHFLWENGKIELHNGSFENTTEMDEGMPSAMAASFINIMGIWITGSFCLLGFVGNVLSFVVLVQAFGRSPMFYVLRAVAVSDAFFLFSVFVIQTLVNMYPYTGVLQWCFEYRGYIQYSLWPILMMTQMSTVWLTVLVSMERYIAICYPLKAASMCTIPKVRRSVIAIFTVSILYNIPRYFEHNIVSKGYMEKSEISNNVVYRYLYMCVLYSLVLFLIPLLLLVILNAKLVLALQRGKRQWQTLQMRQKKEQNLTMIPLTIVLVFFICGVPALVVNIIEAIRPDIQSEGFIQFLVVSNLLVVLNSAANFIIYCLLGKKFRTKLCDICHCHCRPTYRVVHQLVNSQMTDLS